VCPGDNHVKDEHEQVGENSSQVKPAMAADILYGGFDIAWHHEFGG